MDRETWLKQRHPGEKVISNTNGWDHAIYIAGNQWVYRFPKEDASFVIEKEAALLKKVRKLQLPLGVPDPEIVHDANGRAGMRYRHLPGRPLHLRQLTAKQKFQTAAVLGEFLAGLHKISTLPVQAERDKCYYENMYQQIEKELYRHFSSEVRIFTEKIFSFSPKQTVLVHGDLTPDNLLYEKQENKLAVIDFSDAHIGDPALDFAGFYEERDFLHKVVEQYHQFGGERLSLQEIRRYYLLSFYYQLLHVRENTSMLQQIASRLEEKIQKGAVL